MSSITYFSELAKRLRTVFDYEPGRRFQFEKHLSAGSFAMTWRLKWRPDHMAPPYVEYMVVKTEKVSPDRGSGFSGTPSEAAFESDSEDTINRERVWLQILKWAKHIIKMRDVPRDPLASQPLDIQQRFWPSWIYLEYVENGTIFEFIDKARERNSEPPSTEGRLNRFQGPLPNRLLWRFFLCLVRMAVAMAWPPDQPAGPNPQPVTEHHNNNPPRNILHGDLHDGNVMIGPIEIPSVISDMEHEITPGLKLIDWGQAGEEAAQWGIDLLSIGGTPPQARAQNENIFDIAKIMVELITLDPDLGLIFPERPHSRWFTATLLDGRMIETAGSEILPGELGDDPFPNLDNLLRQIVCACLAVDESSRPRLQDLADVVAHEAGVRDYAFYQREQFENGGNVESLRETNQFVLESVTDLLLNGRSRQTALPPLPPFPRQGTFGIGNELKESWGFR